jgi:hypothetical protein
MTRYTKMGGKKSFEKSDGGFSVTPLIPRKQDGVSNHSNRSGNNDRGSFRGGSRGRGGSARGGVRGGSSGAGFKRGRDDDFGKPK